MKRGKNGIAERAIDIEWNREKKRGTRSEKGERMEMGRGSLGSKKP